jgi:hypothetical protein
MLHVALCHTEMARELATIQAVVYSAMESMIGCSENDTIYVEVVGKLVTKIQKLDEQRMLLELPTVRICDLILWPSPGRARLADRLDEAAGQLEVELATRWEADAGLDALCASAA